MIEPTPTPVPAQVMQTIAARLGLSPTMAGPPVALGSSNALYALGPHYLLRVPHQHPTAAPVVHREVAAVAAARAAGVQTPAIILVDDSYQLLPVPFAVYEWFDGIPLAALPPHRGSLHAPWFTLGQDLARLHAGVARDSAAGRTASQNDHYDPWAWLHDLAQTQRLASTDVAWLAYWLTRLAPLLHTVRSTAFCHGDVNASNILVDPATGAYRALIDWGGVVWHDPAWDFVPVPLGVVPAMLAGYRSIRCLPDNARAEGRILAYHLHLAIWSLQVQSRPQPGGVLERCARLRTQVAAFIQQPCAQWLASL